VDLIRAGSLRRHDPLGRGGAEAPAAHPEVRHAAAVAARDAYPRLRPNSNIQAWLVTIAHRYLCCKPCRP